jgi:hypothetical protein
MALPGWTVRGAEVIHTIDLTGRREQLACAKERHRRGDVCPFQQLAGTLVAPLPSMPTVSTSPT